MRAAAAAAVEQQQQPVTTTAGAAAAASNEVKMCMEEKGHRERGVRAAAEKHGENTGHSYKQRAAATAQALQSTAQASEQGAEGGGGVLT